jgi:hypothetical protein
MLGPIWMLGPICTSLPLTGGLLLGLFVAGAVGSTMHCVPMCSGFVLGQVADRVARLPAARLCEWQRMQSGALVPYHLGRLTTYAGLGAVLGAVPWLGALSPVLLLVGAMLFAAHALRRLMPAAARVLPGLDQAPAGWNRVIGRLAGRVRGDGYLLGVALGFLPCGFLYGALAAAAAGGSPLLGAIGMLAFGLGTAPALIAVGIAGQAAGRRWQRGVSAAAPAMMLLNAALLAMLALRSFVAT